MTVRQILICVLTLSPSLALAGQLTTRAQLEAILTDRSILEDFEGFSLQGGSSLTVASPLSSASQPTWHLLSGVTYSSSGGDLTMYSGASNVLNAFNGDLVLTFAKPQAAVGLDLVDGTGNVDFNYTVSYLRGSQTLGTVNLPVPAATSLFAGWSDPAGITAISITGNGQEIDNVEWGANVVPEPGLTCFVLPVVGAVLVRGRRARR